MAISYISNASVVTDIRTKIMDIYLQQGISLSALSLSSKNGDPVWEIYLDKLISDLGPPGQPSLAAATTGGNLPRSTTYFVRVSAIDATGLETPASDTLKKITTGATTDTNKITTTITTITGAVSYNIYVGLGPAAETLVGSTTTTSFIIVDLAPPGSPIPQCDPSIQISSVKNKLDSIPMTGSQLVVNYRIAVWVTTTASAVVYFSVIGI